MVQTVAFEMRVNFDRYERASDKPRQITLVFESLEKMVQRAYIERHRRALTDRATSAQYKLFLTAHGKQAVAACHDCAKRHADVGQWFDV